LRIKNATLLYLNALSGLIVLIIFSFTFRIIWISFLIIAFAIVFFIGSYIDERVNLQRLGERYYLRPSSLQRVEQAVEILLPIFNILAVILLFWSDWWIITHTFEGYVIFSLKLGFYLLIFNRDFGKVGRTLARRDVRNNIDQ